MLCSGLSWQFFDEVGGRPLYEGRPLQAGRWTYRPEAPLSICSFGLGSLFLAAESSSLVALVEVGEVICDGWSMESDRFCPVWYYDPTEELDRFARAQALEVAHLWRAPPLVVDYLESGDLSLRSRACTFIGVATWDRMRSAVWYAASMAAWHAIQAYEKGGAWHAWGAAQRSAQAQGSGEQLEVLRDANAMLESLLVQGAFARELW